MGCDYEGCCRQGDVLHNRLRLVRKKYWTNPTNKCGNLDCSFWFCTRSAADVHLSFTWLRLSRQKWHQLAIFFPSAALEEATEVACTPSDFIGRSQWRIGISLIGHRGGRRPRQNLTQLAGRRALLAAFPNGGKLCTVSVCCGQDPLLGPSWSNGLLVSPEDGEAMCRSGGQPEANSQDDDD
jgi:hypothetical protein